MNPYLFDLVKATQFADHLEANRSEILEVLCRHESFETAVDEIERSVHALRGLHRETAYLRFASLGDVSVFLPVNLPLYSLVLFGAVPSLMAHRVFVRAPAVCPQWVYDVFEVSSLAEFFPRLGVYDLQRREFLKHSASVSNAILFTGRFENAKAVHRACPSARFVFNGAGVNPVVVGEDAQVENILDKIVTTRVFNSGQDCAGPDAFLVHEKVADELVDRLKELLPTLPVGDYSDPAVRIGPILNPGPLPALVKRFEELKADTVLAGDYDLSARVVEPRLIVRPLRQHDHLVEFFAPVFYVLVYQNDCELASFFTRREYQKAAMYVSLFGSPLLPEISQYSNPLIEQTVLDVEHGNEPYGGWGDQANFVAHGDVTDVAPVLVSKALSGHVTPHMVFPAATS